MRTSLHTNWAIAAAWIVSALIFALFVVGVAASALIPFGPPISLGAVLGRIGFSGLFGGHAPWWVYLTAFAVAAIPLLIFTFARSSRLRIAVPLSCLLLPLLLVAWSVKGVAQWILLIPYTPYWTATAFLGQQDGEFYAEGFLVYCAFGWWMILCCVFFFIDLAATRNVAPAA